MCPTYSKLNPIHEQNHEILQPSTQEEETPMPQNPEELSPDLTLSEYMDDHSLRPRLSSSSITDPRRRRERREALAAELEGLVERGEAIGMGEMGRIWRIIEGERG